jgi:sugar lactone lactonase YvrE
MPISHAPEIADLEPWGHDLHRPECVVGTPAGDVFVSDWRGGITAIRAHGSQESWLDRTAPSDLRPNGFALAVDGSFLVANLGDRGGVWRLQRDGIVTPFLTEVNGFPVPPANFVTIDREGRTWISVSTRQHPRHLAWRPDVADGFVVLVDARGARVVADGLHYTNEVRVGPSGDALYVVETFGRRLTRFALARDGSLGARQVVATFGHGGFPDGFEFDAAGRIWITSIVSNRLFRLHGDDLAVMIEEPHDAHVDRVERAFATGSMETSHLGPIPNTTLQHVTSISFGGLDRRTGFLGSLHADHVHRFRMSS